jgi:hypothetical protein
MFLMQRLFLVVYEQLFKLWIVMFEFCKTSISYCANIFFLILLETVLLSSTPCICFFLQKIISYIDYWLGKYFLINDHCFVLKRSAKNWPEGRNIYLYDFHVHLYPWNGLVNVVHDYSIQLQWTITNILFDFEISVFHGHLCNVFIF